MKRCVVVMLVVSWVSCDSGGVVPRDTTAPDEVVADEGFLSDQEAWPDMEDHQVDEAWTGDTVSPDDSALPDMGPEVTMVPQPYIPAKSFRLEPAGREGDALVVHVVAHEFPALFGVALRVEWDPSVLDLRETSIVPVFGEEEGTAVSRAALVRPGSLALAWAFLGSKQEAPLPADTRMATLTFGVLRPASSPLSFFAPRCLVLTRRLDRVEAVYLGAQVAP